MIRHRRFVPLIALFLLFLHLPTVSPARGNAAEIPVAVLRNWQPEYSIDEKTGKPAGFAIEIMEKIAEGSGIQVRYLLFDTWPEAMAAVENNQALVIPNLGITGERLPLYDFTAAYETFHISLFVRRSTVDIDSVEMLTGKRVGVVEKNQGLVLMKNHAGIDLTIFPSLEKAFVALLSGDVDGLVYPERTVFELARRSGIKDYIKTVGPPLQEIKRAIAVKKGNPELYLKLDTAVRQFVNTPEYEQIFRKYFGRPEPFWSVDRVIVVMSVLLGVTAAALLSWRFISISKLNQTLVATVADLEKAEVAIGDSNKKMRLAADSARFGVWDWDIPGNRLEWDDWMLRLYGLSHDDFGASYQAWQARIHPEDVAGFNKKVQKALQGEKELDATFRIVRPDGETRHLKAHATVLRDSRGEPAQMTGINYDVTEQVLSEAALRESEARFKALHNASFGGIAIHDKGTILECNKGLCDISGYTYEELIGMNGLLLISDDTRPMVLQNINAGYEKPYEAKGIRNNGEVYPIRLEARNIPYRGKDVRVVEFRDLTELKKAEAERANLENQLRQAQKMEAVGRLAGGVAHDFNNMLSVIIGHASMALEEMNPSHPLYEDLEAIRKSAERSADLTRQLLAFARKQTVSPRVLDLNRTVEGMTRMLQRLIGEDIDLVWSPGKEVGPVKIDPSQIDQILANLCVNARDAITDVGRVVIETGNVKFDEAYCTDHAGFLPGDYVKLSVSDNGCGMEAGILENIFEPFFTTKESGKGTGLGLATVYGAVKQNNGFINVYSEPGQGTTFRIYLPRHLRVVSHILEQERMPTAEGGHETVLLVEDEPAILRMTRLMLERLGYRVVAAQSPGEAIQLAREYAGKMHLLVTDVVMPEMNGRDLSRELLQFQPNLKCLFMSGYTADVIAHHGILEEGVAFIQKPFSREDLGARIRELLDGGSEKA